MVIQHSTKRWLRIAVFIAVFAAVMSISFLLQASDVPVGAKVLAGIEVPAPVAETVVFELEDAVDGIASWYGNPFHGRRTASGARFNMHEFTAAHRTLPFGTLLRVVNSRTGKAILVEVTDRGPFIRRRVVDLSFAAAKALGVSVTPVEIDALKLPSIASFYEENDSTVLAFSPDIQPVVLSSSRVRFGEQDLTLTQVMKTKSAEDYVVVRPGLEGGNRYSLATVIQ